MLLLIKRIHAYLELFSVMISTQCQHLVTVVIHFISVSTSANGLFMCEVAFRLPTDDALPVDDCEVNKLRILFQQVARLVVERHIVEECPFQDDFDQFPCDCHGAVTYTDWVIALDGLQVKLEHLT